MPALFETKGGQARHVLLSRRPFPPPFLSSPGLNSMRGSCSTRGAQLWWARSREPSRTLCTRSRTRGLLLPHPTPPSPASTPLYPTYPCPEPYPYPASTPLYPQPFHTPQVCCDGARAVAGGGDAGCRVGSDALGFHR